jgi:hypothetical protein
MVATDIKLPSSITSYFDTTTSPLNPGNNPNYQFFVYGTFPLFLTKIFAVIFNLDNYSQIHFVGRILSALFDSANVFLLYFLFKKIWPSLFYAFAVLPLQLSHFFAVDTFLSFFILLSFTLLVNKKYIFSGFAFGLALACKISAIYFLPIIILYLLINKKLLITVYYLLFAFLSFRLFQPYAFVGLFSFNPNFVNSLKQIQAMSAPSIYFPPSIQWMNKTKIIFPVFNIIFWGLGLPFFLSLFFIKKSKINLTIILSFVWIIWLLIYQGLQPVFSMRYFLPIYPFLMVLTLFLPAKIKKIIFCFHCFWGIAFLSIYSRPHSRVQASDWIIKNLSPDSVLSVDAWDDALPLNNSIGYSQITLEIAAPDTPEKWDKINNQLQSIDYLVSSSARAWASTATVPKIFPETIFFYQGFFSQKPVAEFNSYPGYFLPFLSGCFYFGPTNKPGDQSWFVYDNLCLYPGIYFRDDTAEEAFTVYDHPKVVIVENQK